MPPGGGGGCVWKTLPGAPQAPMPEATGVGSLPALNLLFDPRAVHLGTTHYQVLLQHWTPLGWVKQWRHSKAVVFGVDWGSVLALPQPIYVWGGNPRTRASSPTPARQRRPRWPRTWPSRRPSRPQRPAWEPPLRPLPQRLTSEMPGRQYKQQAPVLRLRYGACSFRLIFRSPALICRNEFLIFEPPLQISKVRG